MTTTIALDTALPDRPKVFGVGFHKTATSSLANALYTLGYHVTGYFDTSAFESWQSVIDHSIAVAQRFDAAQDMPWPVMFRELDRAYPGSKFVLTRRDPDRWIASVLEHFGESEIPTHTEIYGTTSAASGIATYVERMQRHDADVIDYFDGRHDDLLVMDIPSGDGWDPLCSFLDEPVPPIAFPVINPGADRHATRARRQLTRAAGRMFRSVGVRDLTLPPSFIDARRAYALVHRRCRRTLALAALRSDLDQRSADLVDEQLGRSWEFQSQWIRRVAGSTPAEPLEWPALILRIRAWTAQLWDDRPRPRTEDGRRPSDALAEFVSHEDEVYATLVTQLRDRGVVIEDVTATVG